MKPRVVSLGIVALLAGCAPERAVTVRFDGLVGDEVARCGGVYTGLGTTGTDLTLGDLRLYVYDLRLVTADGRELPITLDGSDWQIDDIALLDFEDGTADCESGNARMNGEVTGRVEDAGPITGLRFGVGVPEARNHLDVATAEGPLSATAMFWGWNGGYKFLRIDGRTTGQPRGLRFHIGSTGCTGDGHGTLDGCTQNNQASIELSAFDPDTDRVAVDLASFFTESDLDHDTGGVAGCEASFEDPECEPVFHGLGLSFAGVAPTGPQRLFRVTR